MFRLLFYSILLLVSPFIFSSCITTSLTEKVRYEGGYTEQDRIIRVYSAKIDSAKNLSILYKAELHNQDTQHVYNFKVNLNELLSDSVNHYDEKGKYSAYRVRSLKKISVISAAEYHKYG